MGPAFFHREVEYLRADPERGMSTEVETTSPCRRASSVLRRRASRSNPLATR